ncbi:hypothetical protein ACDY97_33815 [Rhizobium mongolense]|uniref:hypothetical protein n=1 Tax=Rhizobium mongolense TaxID=57676 RepID=UPI0035591E38
MATEKPGGHYGQFQQFEEDSFEFIIDGGMEQHVLGFSKRIRGGLGHRNIRNSGWYGRLAPLMSAVAC